MTMMANIKNVIQALQKDNSATSVVYFCGQAMDFNFARLSDDAEVLVVGTTEGCETAIRIASIDGINLVFDTARIIARGRKLLTDGSPSL